MAEYLIVFCTVPDQETGRKISKALLESRLAACVNTTAEINSMYWWEQKLELEKEYLLIIKTRADLYSKVEDTIRNNHPYDVPEVIALPIVLGSAAYLKWIESETGQKEK